MIRLENVCFAYEKEIALRYVDLHINRGDSIVIQGPNGCGKSTLIKLLNGIIFPSEGKYFYQGHEINEVSLACILSLNPEVLILDEPLAGLDEKTQDMLVDFLQSFHKAGKTLITITHNRQLAETIGTRFACMNEEHELKMLS